MAVGNVKTTCLTIGAVALVILAGPASAQPECESANKDCLDYCHYAPENQWTSGFKCKRRCREQLDRCRRGMRGYAPRYDSRGYDQSYGRGSGAPYGYGAPAGQQAPARQQQVPAQSTYAPQTQAAPATGYYGAPAYSRGYAPATGYYPGTGYGAPAYGYPSSGAQPQQESYPPPP